MHNDCIHSVGERDADGSSFCFPAFAWTRRKQSWGGNISKGATGQGYTLPPGAGIDRCVSKLTWWAGFHSRGAISVRGRETRQAKALDFHLQDSAPCACLSACACVCVPVWKVKKNKATNVKPKQTKGKEDKCASPLHYFTPGKDCNIAVSAVYHIPPR